MRFRFSGRGQRSRGSHAKALVLLTLVATAVLAVPTVAQGIERVEVFVGLAPELINTLIVYAVPVNVTSPLLFTMQSLYVLVGRIPKLSFAFSSHPAVVVFAEPYAYTDAVYEVWYGGENPYPQFIAMPGTNASIWYAYDEFDWPTEMWGSSNAEVSASKATVRGPGFMVLKAGYPSESAVLWLLSGRRSLQIEFPEPVSEFVAFTLTSANFTDIDLVKTIEDIYFTDPAGQCLPYAMLYADLSKKVITVAVNPQNNTIVYMLYGGANPCTVQRVL